MALQDQKENYNFSTHYQLFRFEIKNLNKVKMSLNFYL